MDLSLMIRQWIYFHFEVAYFSTYKSTYALDFHCWNYVRTLGMDLIVSHSKYIYSLAGTRGSVDILF